jgi:hypothetical protein
LLCNEAVFAGDPRQVRTFKALITDPTLPIEPKFRDITLAPNLLHTMITTNDDRAVAASLRDRRSLVLHASDAHAHEKAYFEAIYDELDNGGYETMLYDLQQMDLTDFDFRHAPQTEALIGQKHHSLPTHLAWWRDNLLRGYVFEANPNYGLEDDLHVWLDPVSMELLFKSYSRYAREHHERAPLARNLLGSFITNDLGGKGCRPQRAVVGEHMTEGSISLNQSSGPSGYNQQPANAHWATRVPEVVWDDRPYCYSFGTLAEAREEFNKRTKLGLDWGDSLPQHP